MQLSNYEFKDTLRLNEHQISNYLAGNKRGWAETDTDNKNINRQKRLQNKFLKVVIDIFHVGISAVQYML